MFPSPICVEIELAVLKIANILIKLRGYIITIYSRLCIDVMLSMIGNVCINVTRMHGVSDNDDEL